MKIYIKAPLYKNSTYIPHLLEHCFLNKMDFELYLEYTFEVEWFTNAWYININWLEKQDIDKYIEMILEKPTKEQIKYEKNIIKTEINESSTWNKLYDAVWKRLLWNDFSTFEVKKYSIDEIINYHWNTVNIKNIIVTNNNHKIQWKMKLYNMNKNHSFDLKYLDNFIIDKQKYKVIYIEYKSPFDYLLMDFINNLFYSQIEFNNRFQIKQFYYDLSWLMQYPGFLAISIPQDFSVINSFNFQLFKKLFIERIFKYNKYFYQTINYILLDKFISTNDYKKYISQIDDSIMVRINKILTNSIGK